MKAARALALILLAGAVSGTPAAAASFALGEAEKVEAIRFGERSVTTETFGAEWSFSSSAGEVTVMTPFYRLALAARQAAFKQTPLKPAEIEKLLRADWGRLVFWVSLSGPRSDFARFYAPVLAAGRDEVRAAFVQNERTALRQADGRYLARCVYGFPTAPLSAKGRFALVVRDRDAREVARFPLDLATIR